MSLCYTSKFYVEASWRRSTRLGACILDITRDAVGGLVCFLARWTGDHKYPDYSCKAIPHPTCAWRKVSIDLEQSSLPYS